MPVDRDMTVCSDAAMMINFTVSFSIFVIYKTCMEE